MASKKIKKKLTLKQAWKQLKKWWESAEKTRQVWRVVTAVNSSGYCDGIRISLGLCGCLLGLLRDGAIKQSTYNSIARTIDAEMCRLGRVGWLYERDEQGAKQRVEFCKKQIKRLEKLERARKAIKIKGGE